MRIHLGSDFRGHILSRSTGRAIATPGAIGDRLSMHLCTLPWSDLRRTTIRDAEISGTSLWHSIFGFADISRSSFAGCDLRGCDLRECLAKGTDFSDCDLTGANFTNADLTGACFVGASLEFARFDGATLTAATFDGASVAQSNAPVSRLDMHGISAAIASGLPGLSTIGGITMRNEQWLDATPEDERIRNLTKMREWWNAYGDIAKAIIRSMM